MSDKNAQSNNWLDQVTWNEQGLVAVIAQEFDTGDVLMVSLKKKDLAQG
jgi:phosphoribosyl-AMP cyclohydrolase